MTAPTQATDHRWPADVLAFATEQGIVGYLASVQEMTRRLFPRLPIETTVVADPEIADERYLSIWVEVPELTADEYAAVRNQWYAELRRLCPRDIDRSFFLGMHGGRRS